MAGAAAAASSGAGAGEAAWAAAAAALWRPARPLLVAARALGVAPVRLPSPAAPAAAASCAWRAYSLALAALVALWLARELALGLGRVWPRLPPTLVVPDVLNVVFLGATGLAALLALTARSHALARILNSMPTVDAALTWEPVAPAPSSAWRAQLLVPAAATVGLTALLGALDCVVWDASLLGRLSVQFVILALDALFVGLVLFLRSRLRRTNRLIEEHLCRPAPLVASAAALFDEQVAARAAACALSARGHLDALAAGLNAAFGAPLLLELTGVPVGVVCCVYAALATLASASPRPANATAQGNLTRPGSEAGAALMWLMSGERVALGAASLFAWAAFRALKLLVVAAACQAAAAEARRSGPLVQRALLVRGAGGGAEGATARRLRLLAQQLLQQPLRFSAAGCFALDCSLLYNYAGAVATYLVVLLQFQYSDSGSRS